ncbi:MAG: beta-ketoacyl synthase N-terminal-like domain-containing protein, partial [Planctomycetota bacterium]
MSDKQVNNPVGRTAHAAQQRNRVNQLVRFGINADLDQALREAREINLPWYASQALSYVAAHAPADEAFVPGEGAGVLVLKRLEDAEEAGDRIYGVIRGSGINQDGKTNGITAPSMHSQAALLRDIYDRYQIDPGWISYVEAHG